MSEASPFDCLHAHLTLLKAHARMGQPGVDSFILLFSIVRPAGEYRHAEVQQTR